MGIDSMQWLAMAATVSAAWLVAAQDKRHRKIGFWVYLLSNALWVLWGVHDRAWALVVLQFCLAALNVRGVSKNEPKHGGAGSTGARA